MHEYNLCLQCCKTVAITLKPLARHLFLLLPQNPPVNLFVFLSFCPTNTCHPLCPRTVDCALVLLSTTTLSRLEATPVASVCAACSRAAWKSNRDPSRHRERTERTKLRCLGFSFRMRGQGTEMGHWRPTGHLARLPQIACIASAPPFDEVRRTLQVCQWPGIICSGTCVRSPRAASTPIREAHASLTLSQRGIRQALPSAELDCDFVKFGKVHQW